VITPADIITAARDAVITRAGVAAPPLSHDTIGGWRAYAEGRAAWQPVDVAYITAAARRVARVAAAATPEAVADGMAWYATARVAVAAAARDHGLPFTLAAAAVAAVSPGMPWQHNIRALAVAVDAARAVRVAGASVDAAVAAARARHSLSVGRQGYAPLRAAVAVILRGVDALRGPKVTAFYHGIITGGHTVHVAVDGHAALAATSNVDAVRPGITEAPRLTAREYHRVALAYAAAAEVIGLPPAVLQAVVWVAWRAIPWRAA
jgi:hypothetical protein